MDRNNHGGGVALYCKQFLHPHILDDLQQEFKLRNLEVVITRIKVGKPARNLFVVGVYRPPQSAVAWFDVFNELVLSLSAKGDLIIMGDLNADLMEPDRYPASSLLQSLALASTSIDNVTPTRLHENGGSCLDIIAIPDTVECVSYAIGNKAASDHFPVHASIRVEYTEELKPVYKRSYRRTNMDELKSRVELISLQDNDSEEMLNNWMSEVEVILDDMAPMKLTPLRKNGIPFMNNNIRELQRRRDFLAKHIRRRRNAATGADWDELRAAKRQVKSAIRQASKDHASSLLEDRNSRGAWRFIRETTFTCSKTRNTSLNAEHANNYFAEIVKSETDTDVRVPQFCDNVNAMNIRELQVTDVQTMLSQLKASTAPGCDKLPGFLLKSLAKEIAPNLTKIINCSVTAGLVPSLWKQANVTAVYKGKGAKDNPANYRPISILPILGRMMEKAIATQLYQHCEQQQIIPNTQFGFRRNSSCETALIAATDSWMTSLDEGMVVGALLLDFSKAFDMVPHSLLLNELCKINLSMAALQWFHSYLDQRKQRVANGQQQACWRDVTRGVPQGSGLSPLLFNIFVRNLPLDNPAKTHQFADDVTHSAAAKLATEVVSTLEESFRVTKEFCDTKGILINATKTQFVIFRAPGKRVADDIEIHVMGHGIQHVRTVKLLGMTLDRGLTFGPHITGVVQKCNGLLGMLAKAAPYLPSKILKIAYFSLIRTNLEYASAVYASASITHLKKLDTLQKIASRIISHAPSRAHSAPLIEALGLQALNLRRNNHIAQIVSNCLTDNCHPALSDMFVTSTTSAAAVQINNEGRIQLGKRKFSNFAADIYNSHC